MTYTLIHIAFALAAGLLMTRVFKVLKLNFPDVTAYLITGLLIGPYGLGRLGVPGLGFADMESLKALEIIPTAALGFIAFAIGNEFKISQLKGIGRQAAVIGVFQAVAATAAVDVILISAAVLSRGRLSVPAAVTLGAIASATAPAATLMVVRQYKAHGKLTSLLLPIVALDDAVGLVIFAVSFGISQSMLAGTVSLISLVINPLIEILASVILGGVLGWILTQMEELFFSNTNRLSLTIAFVFVTIALSTLSFRIGPVTVSFSSLLVCMMLGTVLCNLCPRSGDIMHRADGWTAPMNVLFFVLSGAELDLGVMSNVFIVGIGVLYIISRSLGKYYGARLSASFSGCDKNTCRYLGYTLFPQAGVALGMSAQAVRLGSTDGTVVRNIILFSVLIYELFGPSITRWALTKTGDISSVPEEKKTHERFDTPKEHRLKTTK